MPYVFAVDGGGTQSRSVLLTDDGRVVHIGKGPGVNYHDVGAVKVSTTLNRLFNDALTAARARREECLGMCFGLAGVGREQDRTMLMPLFNDQFGENNFMLLSDAEIALVSGTLSEYGIVVIAGTGSMIFGRNEKSEEGRVGGYGPLVSDEGSGYRIAVEGLRAIVRNHDGCGINTVLQNWILSLLNLKTVEELVNWINSPSATRDKIAALAPLVIKAASESDAAADEILNQQADLLAINVDTLHKKLNFPERCEVVLSGGIFDETSFYRQVARRKILYLLPGADVLSPRFEPVFGAALYAYTLAGINLDEDLLDTVRRTHREYLQGQQPPPAVAEPEPEPATQTMEALEPEAEREELAPLEKPQEKEEE